MRLNKKLNTYTFRDSWQSSYVRSNEIRVLIDGKKIIDNLSTQEKILSIRTQHLGFPTPSVFKQIAIFLITFLLLLDKELSRSRHEMTSSSSAQHKIKRRKCWAAVLK